MFVSTGCPFRHQLNHGRDLRISTLGENDDALLFEELKCVLEGLFVHRLEVGEIALMIQGFAKLMPQFSNLFMSG